MRQRAGGGNAGASKRLRSLRARRLLAGAAVTAAALAVGLAAVVPFYSSGSGRTPLLRGVQVYLSTHDLVNLLPMMREFDKGLTSGSLYPRWSADFNKGYGSAAGNFYPPGVFYIGSLLNRLLNDWASTLFVICTLSLAASGVGLYVLSRTFHGKAASATAAVFYMLAPYHMVDLYWRGAIPEFVAFAIMPVILILTIKLGSTGRLRYVAGVGLAHGALVMVHLPVGLLFTYSLALYALIWSGRAKDVRVGLRIAGGVALALALSAIYWLPAALEGEHAYDWLTKTFPYHQNYITLVPNAEPFGSRVNGSFALLAVVVIAALAILLAVKAKESSDASALTQCRLWMVLGPVTLFMSASLSFYISELIPKIEVAAFPFRWLALASLFAALLVGAAVERLRKPPGLSRWKLVASRAAIGGAIVWSLWFTIDGVIIQALSKPLQLVPEEYLDPAYIPQGATPPRSLPQTPQVVAQPTATAVEVTRWEPVYREMYVNAEEPSQLRLRTYNFYGWTARIDGAATPISSDTDGAQTLKVGPGTHKIQVSFGGTPPRIAGEALFGAGLLLSAGLIGWDLRRGRQRA